MPSINDWAAEAAKKISSEFPSIQHSDMLPSDERIAAIIATFAEPLVKLVKASYRSHYHCDDSWYCCGKCVHPDHSDHFDDYPASHDGEGARTQGLCNCGADAWNAKIDKALEGA